MRQGSVQFGHDDDRALVAAGRQSELAVRESAVRRYGQEILRTAYLLTDDRQRAWSIARLAFVELFKELPRLEDDSDLRCRLLIHTGHIFLAPPVTDDESQVPLSMPLEGASQRYQVDDARSKTRAALQVLDPPVRLALLLRDLNGLEIERISTLVQKRVDVLTVALEASRVRVRGYVDLPAHEPLRGTLTAAGFDAPAGNLWTVLADDAADLLRRSDSRSRLVTVGVVAATVVVLAIALLFLFRNSPEEQAVVMPVATEASETERLPARVVLAAEGTPTPQNEQEPEAASTAIVPDRLLMALEDTNAADGLANLTEFRPTSPIAVRPVSEWQSPVREEWPPLLSPDGRQMFITRYESGGSETRVVLAALDSATFAENWTAELATIEGAMPLDRKPAMLVSLAVGAERVYASLHPWESDDPIRIVAFDLETGRLANAWSVGLVGVSGNDVRIVIPPGGDRLHLFSIIGDGASIGGQMQLAFFSYQLPDGERIHGKALLERSSTRVFYIYQGNVTADGRSMYGLTHNGNSSTLAVQFFDLMSATMQPPLPIRFQVEGSQLPLHEAVSHDGRWLYVFSPLSAEMAIVDLHERALLGIIPLDIQAESAVAPAAVHPRDNTMQISPDGSRIYAIGAATAGGSTTSGVWVIDTSTWTLTDHWLPQSAPDRILLSGDGQTLYLHGLDSPVEEASAGTLWAIDTTTGDEIPTNGLAFLPEATEIQLQTLAAIYRHQYGRSPNLEGTQSMDNRAFTSLPAVEASINPADINPGQEVTIDVRFRDPFSNDVLVEGDSDTRFQPSGGVRAVLSNTSGEDEDIILELGRLGYAEYRATVVLPSPGEWTLSLVNDWSPTQSTPRLLNTSATVTVLIPVPGLGGGSLNVIRR